MDNAEMLTPKEVGKRIKERRNEIGISMPELGRRVGVNKSTIQRYETDGVNPNRSMIINGLADALQTTPEWLTGLSEEKEVKDVDGRTICEGKVMNCLRLALVGASSGLGIADIVTIIGKAELAERIEKIKATL